MRTLTHHGLAGGLSALVFVLAGTAWAQNAPPRDSAQEADTMGQMHSGQDDMKGMHKHMMDKNMMGMHTMPATVNSVDQQTGVVEVTSEGTTLRVHFPASALANLKAGDQITLHMGYSKP